MGEAASSSWHRYPARRLLFLVGGQQPVHDAGPLAQAAGQAAPAGVAGGGDVLEADGGPGELGADRPAQEPGAGEDADLGHVPRVVADDHAVADVGGQDRVQVAQPLEVDPVRVDLARLGHGEQQQVELFERVGHPRDERAGFPALLRRHPGLAVRGEVVDLPDEGPIAASSSARVSRACPARSGVPRGAYPGSDGRHIWLMVPKILSTLPRPRG